MQSSIPEFYNGKSVFITGGLGFIGKVLVEKLLRSCPGIVNIYLIVRQKKGKSIEDRFNDLKNSQIFDIIRAKSPNSIDKIILMEGDISKNNLGLSELHRNILIKNVSVIVNSAATIKFNEPLRSAIDTNLKSLHELIKLSHMMKNLKVRK